MIFTKRWFLLLSLISITFLAFVNIIDNEFAYDDNSFIVSWEQIRQIENLPSLYQGDLPVGHQGVYRPLRSLFYTISYKLYGQNPQGYHIQAITVHIINTLLVYLIVLFLLKNNTVPYLTA